MTVTPALSTAELVGTGEQGTIYLLHFARPFGHASHYLGWAKTLDKRLAVHGKAHGSALMRAVAGAGIDWQLARTWPGDRHRERQLKNQGSRARLCPICRAATKTRSKTGDRAQLPLALGLDPTATGDPAVGDLSDPTPTTTTTGGDAS